jgi:hypothetical protein
MTARCNNQCENQSGPQKQPARLPNELESQQIGRQRPPAQTVSMGASAQVGVRLRTARRYFHQIPQ